MATYHIDPVAGNDANTGLSWAQPWKTFTNGATAARIAPGDTIKVAKSPDPVSLGQTASWTNLSPTVTLTTAVTKHIARADANTWTVSANVTGAASAVRKLGTVSQDLQIGAAFTTGKIAYVAVEGGGTQDFSSYTKISLWINPSAVVAGSTLQLKLCSDAIGDVAVNTLSLPALATANTYHCIELDNGGPLGASIQSVAIYAILDPGTVNLRINNIIAGTTLTHKSLISKNTGEETMVWWPIMGIDGTAITIDLAGSHNTVSRGYYGVTENATIWVRDSFTLMAANGGAIANTLTDSGTPSGRITYSGGWNTASNLQDGYTVFDGVNLGGYAFALVGPFNTMQRLCAYRYAHGFWNAGAAFVPIIEDGFMGCMGSYGYTYNGGSGTKLNDYSFVCNSISGLVIQNGANIVGKNVKSLSNGQAGILAGLGTVFYDSIFANNGSGSVRYDSTYHLEVNHGAYFKHCVFDDTTEVYSVYTPTNAGSTGMIWSFHHDHITDNNWGFSDGATVNWQSAVFQGSDPGSWKVAITNSGRTNEVPVLMKLDSIGITAGSLVTASIWCKKDHATNVGAEFYIRGEEYNLPGIVADTAVKANDTNWEQLTITFQATEDGIVTLWMKAYYISGNSNVYFGSIDISQ